MTAPEVPPDAIAGARAQKLAKAEEIHEEFRVFITCEPHKRFPIGLLQMSIKITNEAPAGIKAGLKRSYHWVSQDMLDAISRSEWRQILYVMCFCHSIVQERRKFGPIGWAIPYEYNQGDLTACTNFLQNHMGQMEAKASRGGSLPLQWVCIKYMIAEVQYGGRITCPDDSMHGVTEFERVKFGTRFIHSSRPLCEPAVGISRYSRVCALLLLYHESAGGSPSSASSAAAINGRTTRAM